MRKEQCTPMSKPAVIEIIGVGGGGCNAVHYMLEKGMKDVAFFVSDTDQSVLNRFPEQNTIQLGFDALGVGSEPEKVRVEYEKHVDKIKAKFVKGTNIAFIVSSFGGGCGTGAAPVIAKAAKDSGMTTIGVITLPFPFEGKKHEIAIDGVRELSPHVDAMFLLNNQYLLDTQKELSLPSAFKKGDELMCEVVRSIVKKTPCAPQ